MTAADDQSFCSAWLDIAVSRLQGTRLACVLHRTQGQGQGREFRPLAQWPVDGNARRLGEVVQQALDTRQLAETQQEAAAPLLMAFPVEAADQVIAVVALEFEPRDAAVRLANLREIYWSCAWLRLLGSDALHPDRGASPEGADTAARIVLRAISCVQACTTADEAGLALSNLVAVEFAARRVSLALYRGSRLRLCAVSSTPWLDPKSDLVVQLEAVARECADHRRIVDVDGGSGASTLSALAAAQHCLPTALPLSGCAARPAGVLIVERAPELPLSTYEQVQLEQVARWCGPALELQAEQDRWWTGRAARHARSLLTRLADRRRPSLLLGLGAGLLALAFVLLVPVAENVTATAVVEGAREISVGAPFDGFVSRPLRRAGDVVRQGEALATLDDRQFRLDHERALAQQLQGERRYVDALSRRERAAAGMAQASVQEAAAEVALAQYRLDHATLRADADAFVVTGDLSQQVGAPVRKGQVLFRLAPIDAYRVMLHVDERDLRLIQPGQEGDMVLASDTARTRRVKVLSIGAASASGGTNGFLVEAAVQPGSGGLATLRPGMEGVAKIEVTRAPLAQAWTRRARQWLEAAWFRWTP